MRVRIPDQPETDQPCAISGRAFNALRRAIESFRISVAPPLELIDVGDGSVMIKMNGRGILVGVRIDTPAVRGGAYWGGLLRTPDALLIDGAGQIADADLGVLINPATHDTYILNAQERASNSHGLTINSTSPIFCKDFRGEWIGTNADGFHVVVINGFNIRFC